MLHLPWRRKAGVASLLLLGGAGCLDFPADGTGPAGSERGSCHADGTCDEGLICASGLCVRVGDAGAPAEPRGARAAYGLGILFGSGPCAFGLASYAVGEDPAALRGDGGQGRVHDGDAGVRVECRVSGSPRYRIEAFIQVEGEAIFALDGEGTGALGTASISEWNRHTRTTLSSDGCSLGVLEQDEGSIRAEFTCSTFTSNESREASCASHGVFVLEGCETS